MSFRKQDIFNMFAMLRRLSRELIRESALYSRIWRLMERDQARMVAAGNPFDANRIKALGADIEELRALGLECDKKLANMGPVLFDLCAAADAFFTFRDKAHALGVSETHLRRQMHGDHGEETSRLYTLIFACHGEYRGKEDFIGPDQFDMPLWEVASAWFRHLLHHNQDFAAMASGVLDRVFPNMAKYQMTVMPDGSQTLTRMPPQLRLIRMEAQS